MGLMNKLFGKQESHPAEAEVECPHKTLTARWDRPEDMGREDLATSFRCESCGESFSGDDGRRLLHERTILTP